MSSVLVLIDTGKILEVSPCLKPHPPSTCAQWQLVVVQLKVIFLCIVQKQTYRYWCKHQMRHSEYAPATPPVPDLYKAVTFNSQKCSFIVFTWSVGGGEGSLVLMKQGSST